jgi:hypothetical protein
MRHVVVRRAAAGLAVLFVVSAGVFAWFAAPGATREESTGEPDEPPAAAAVFDRYCGSCHAAADLRTALGDGDEEARRRLELFLGDHGAAPADDDRLIADYLAQLP